MINLTSDFKNRLNGEINFNRFLSIQGEEFRNVPGRKTMRFEVEDRGYYIKLHFGVGIKEILKNLLQLKLPVLGAKNEYLAIKCLTDLRIDTMQIAGYGCRGSNPASKQSFIITEELTNTISLEDYCRNWSAEPPIPSLKRKLITQVALIARKLHENGLNHRDFYICHFLLKLPFDPEHQDLRLYLIDLHRVQIRKKTPHRWIIKDIAGLYFSAMDIGLTKYDLFRFIKIYKKKSLREIFKNEKYFLKQVQQKAEALYASHSQKKY